MLVYLFFILYILFNSKGDAFASFYVCILLCKVDLILLFSFLYSSKLNLFCYFLFFIFLEVFFLNYLAGYVYFQFATCGGFKACATKGLHFPLVHLSTRLVSIDVFFVQDTGNLLDTAVCVSQPFFCSMCAFYCFVWLTVSQIKSSFIFSHPLEQKMCK